MSSKDFEQFFQPQEPKRQEKIIHKTDIFSSPEEEILTTREKIQSKDLHGGGYSFLIELRDDGSGIFKPRDGEVELRSGIERGTYYKRERAAYLVDRFLGLDLVSVAVIREIDGRIGSLQQFISNAENIFDIPQQDRKSKELQSDLLTMGIFDYLIYNSDRHSGNFLIKGRKVYAIDNGLSFGKEEGGWNSGYNDSDCWYNILDIPLSPQLIEKFKKFSSQTDARRILEKLLKELLPKGEVKAFFKRLDRISKLIIEQGCIPVSEEKNLTYN